MSIEVPLLWFHFTVLTCVIRCVMKKEKFAQGVFFKIFVLKSLVDYVSYALVGVCEIVERES